MTYGLSGNSYDSPKKGFASEYRPVKTVIAHPAKSRMRRERSKKKLQLACNPKQSQVHFHDFSLFACHRPDGSAPSVQPILRLLPQKCTSSSPICSRGKRRGALVLLGLRYNHVSDEIGRC